jgi:hypothetical protein
MSAAPPEDHPGQSAPIIPPQANSCAPIHTGPFRRTFAAIVRCNGCDQNVSDAQLLAVYRANGKINWGI